MFNLNLNFIIRKVITQIINKINQFFEKNYFPDLQEKMGYFLNLSSFSFIITYKNNVLFPFLQQHQISQLVDFKFTLGFISIIFSDIIYSQSIP